MLIGASVWALREQKLGLDSASRDRVNAEGSVPRVPTIRGTPEGMP